MHLHYFGSVASMYVCMYVCMGWSLKSLFLPTRAWREILCCWSNCLGLNGHSEEFRMRYLHWKELTNVNYEQITLRFLGSNWTCLGECLWQNKATNDKNSSHLSQWRRDGGQPDKEQDEQQQQQPANHSSDNAEIARCLTPFSHPSLIVFCRRIPVCST